LASIAGADLPDPVEKIDLSIACEGSCLSPGARREEIPRFHEPTCLVNNNEE
jgi:hypothetical protein